MQFQNYGYIYSCVLSFTFYLIIIIVINIQNFKINWKKKDNYSIFWQFKFFPCFFFSKAENDTRGKNHFCKHNYSVNKVWKIKRY